MEDPLHQMIDENITVEKVDYPRIRGFKESWRLYINTEIRTIYHGLYEALADPFILFKRLFSTKEIDKAIRPKAQWYEKYPDNPNGIAIIASHGFGSTPEMFHDVDHYFTDAGYYVRFIRLSGHGTTAGHLANTNATEWLASVIWHYREVRKKFKRIYYLGHSLGGTLGLLSSTIDGIKYEGVAAMATPIELNIPTKRFAKQASVLIKYWPRSKKKREYIERNKLAAYRKTPLYALSGVFDAEKVLRERADRVTVPTLYIKAAKDASYFQDQDEVFDETFQLSDKTIKVAENTSHSVFLGSEVEQIINWILEWIKEISSRVDLYQSPR
ncbi:MAG: alpha/beta fold hydrolase [Candidatus Heimdallarchaeota archaeon]|nr:alpha/beta fold hydrolase [Candidatus Heimdallarchaeota archaeon]